MFLLTVPFVPVFGYIIVNGIQKGSGKDFKSNSQTKNAAKLLCNVQNRLRFIRIRNPRRIRLSILRVSTPICFCMAIPNSLCKATNRNTSFLSCCIMVCTAELHKLQTPSKRMIFFCSGSDSECCIGL